MSRLEYQNRDEEDPQPIARPRWVLPLVVLVLVGSVAGWVAMEFVAPRLIESAARGESGIGALNDYFKSKGADARWLNRVNKLGSTLLVTGVVFGILAFVSTGRWFSRKLAGVATAGELGATRFLACGILFWSAVWEDLASTSMLPREFLRPMGTMTFVRKIPGFEQMLASYSAMAAWEWMTCIALFLGMIGLWSRVTVPLATIGYFVFAGTMRSYTWFWHVGLIPLFVLLMLSFMPSGDGFSMDRLRRLAKGQPVAPREQSTPFYGWCIYLCWLPVCIAYLWAGMSKIAWGGWNWWRADNLRGIIVQDSLQPMEFDTRIGQNLAHAPGILFATMGIGAIVTELAGILPVLYPRSSRAAKYIRWIVPVSLAGTHVGIWVMQNILFFDLILIQAMFIDWRSVRKWIGARLNARSGHLEVVTPSALSERARRILVSLDLFERLHWGERTSVENPPITGDLRVVHRGEQHAGDDAVRAIARVIPALWVFLPLLAIKSLAANLLRRLTASTGPASDVIAPRSSFRPLIKTAICLFVTLWVAVWFNRIEFFPLTSVQMYTKRDREMGVIYYTRVLAHYADGRTGRAHLEEGIGALADGRYRRVLDFALSRDPRNQAIANRVLQTCASAMNQDADTPAERIVRFEVQRVVWHFKRNPDDPDKGEITYRYFADVS